MVDRTSLMSRKMLDIGEHRTAFDARDAALPRARHHKTGRNSPRAGLHCASEHPATAAQHFARIGVGGVNPTGDALVGRPAAEAAGRTQARAATRRGSTIHLLRSVARAKLGLPQIELNGVPAGRSRGIVRLEVVRAVQLLYQLDEREIAIPIFADMGENGDPDALVGLGELASRHADARSMLVMGKAALNRGLPFDFYAYPVTGIPPFKSIGPEVEQSIMFAIARPGKRLQSVRGFAGPSLRADAGDAGCRPLCLQEIRREL
jgi:soluble lytic murein transglycosylase